MISMRFGKRSPYSGWFLKTKMLIYLFIKPISYLIFIK